MGGGTVALESGSLEELTVRETIKLLGSKVVSSIARVVSNNDDSFVHIMKHDFLIDLIMISQLAGKEKLTAEEKEIWEKYHEKYNPGGRCPSFLYPLVSRGMQQQYWIVHDTICELLYRGYEGVSTKETKSADEIFMESMRDLRSYRRNEPFVAI